MADAVYWMARYIERAENVARFIDVNLHLQLDLPLEPAHQWQPLIDTSGDAEVFRERHGKAKKATVIKFLVWDTEQPEFHLLLPARRPRERPLRSRDHLLRDVGAGQQHVPEDPVAARHCRSRSAWRRSCAASAWAATCLRESPTPP